MKTLVVVEWDENKVPQYNADFVSDLITRALDSYGPDTCDLKVRSMGRHEARSALMSTMGNPGE